MKSFSKLEKEIGKELAKRVLEVFEDKKNAARWFYSPLIALGGKRPYDLYKEGKTSEIETILGRIEHGTYS